MATFAAATAALAAVGATLGTAATAGATAPPPSEPAPSEPAATESTAQSGSISGGAEHDLSPEEEAAFQVEVEFAQCMRDHGIAGLPEPQVTEDGFVLVGFPLVLPGGLGRGPRGLSAHLRRGRPAGYERRCRRLGTGGAWRRLYVCRWQRVRLLGAPRRPDQGRVLSRRRRLLFRRDDLRVHRPFRRRRSGEL